MNHLIFALKNVTQNNSDGIEFDIFVTNDGDSQLKLDAAQFGIFVDTSCLPAGAVCSNSYVGGSDVIPPCSLFFMPQCPYPGNFRFVQSPQVAFQNQAPVLPNGQQVKLGHFVLLSNSGFVVGSKPNLKLQATNVPGKTNCVAVVYVDGAQSTTALSSPSTILTTNDCQLTIQ